MVLEFTVADRYPTVLLNNELDLISRVSSSLSSACHDLNEAEDLPTYAGFFKREILGAGGAGHCSAFRWCACSTGSYLTARRNLAFVSRTAFSTAAQR